MAPVFDPVCHGPVTVGTSALGGPEAALTNPLHMWHILAPGRSQADIFGCFWLPVQEGETCSPSIWLQLQSLLHTAGPGLAQV